MCFRKLTKNAASVYDGYKKKNPLMARKKLSVKDVVFRRNDPDTELFRLELAWDTELYVLLALLLLLAVLAAWKICGLFRR